MSGGCHDISERERTGNEASCDQTRWMGHVHQQIGSNFITDVSELLVVNESAVSRGSCYDKLRAVDQSIST